MNKTHLFILINLSDNVSVFVNFIFSNNIYYKMMN